MLELVNLSPSDIAVLAILAYGFGIGAGLGLKYGEDFSAKVVIWPLVVAIDFYTWTLAKASKWLVDG